MSAVQFILSSIIIFLQEDNVQLQQMENELVRRPSKEARRNVNAKVKFWHIDFEILDNISNILGLYTSTELKLVQSSWDTW